MKRTPRLSAFDSFCAESSGASLRMWATAKISGGCSPSSPCAKPGAQARRNWRLKRGGGAVVRETDLAAGGNGDEDILDGVVSPQPEPEFAALAEEELRRLLDSRSAMTLSAASRSGAWRIIPAMKSPRNWAATAAPWPASSS